MSEPSKELSFLVNRLMKARMRKYRKCFGKYDGCVPSYCKFWGECLKEKLKVNHNSFWGVE